MTQYNSVTAFDVDEFETWDEEDMETLAVFLEENTEYKLVQEVDEEGLYRLFKKNGSGIEKSNQPPFRPRGSEIDVPPNLDTELE